MKFLSLFLFLAFGFQSTAQNHQVVAIGFYNLENLFDTLDTPNVNDEEFTPNGPRQWTGERYLDKLTNLSTVIADMGIDVTPDGPAILGVSEIENQSVLEDLVKQERIKGRDYHIVHYDSPDRRGIDVGLLYQPKYFKVLGSQSVFLDVKGNDGQPVITRDILHVHGELFGQEIHVFVNHWPSRRGGEKASRPLRNAAAKRNRELVDSILTLTPEVGILVMGDLNDDPVNQSVKQILRAKPSIEKTSSGDFYNPWHAYYKKGMGSNAYRDAWSLFDQIVISKSLLAKKPDQFYYLKSSIVNKPYLIQPKGHYRGYPYRTFDFDDYISGYSDHFPVVTYFVRPIPH